MVIVCVYKRIVNKEMKLSDKSSCFYAQHDFGFKVLVNRFFSTMTLNFDLHHHKVGVKQLYDVGFLFAPSHLAISSI